MAKEELTIKQIVDNRQQYFAIVRGIEKKAPLMRPGREIDKDSEARSNYDNCALLAFNIRLADQDSKDNPNYIKQVFDALERNPKLRFYIAYLWATDSVEMAEDFELGEYTPSEEVGSYMTESLLNSVDSFASDETVMMLNDIFQRAVEYVGTTGKTRGVFSQQNLLKIAEKYQETRGVWTKISEPEKQLRLAMEIVKKL